MSLSVEACLKKLRILSGQEYFVRDEVLLKALAKKICSCVEDGAHADRMLDAWVEKTKSMLHISDVAALAADTATPSKRSNGCGSCLDGFVLAESCYVFCNCWAGQFRVREQEEGERMMRANQAAAEGRKSANAGRLTRRHAASGEPAAAVEANPKPSDAQKEEFASETVGKNYEPSASRKGCSTKKLVPTSGDV